MLGHNLMSSDVCVLAGSSKAPEVTHAILTRQQSRGQPFHAPSAKQRCCAHPSGKHIVGPDLLINLPSWCLLIKALDALKVFSYFISGNRYHSHPY